MFACRKVRGLIAASAYDELREAEKLTLDGHLASCAACRTEAQSLRALAARIPSDPVPLDRDLLPLLRRRMAQDASRKPVFVWRFRPAYGVVMAALLVAIFGTVYVRQNGTSVSPPLQVVAVSPFAEALVAAESLLENRDFTGAYRRLKETIASRPEDSLAGQLELECADIAFAKLQWYPEAHQTYDALAERYPAIFSASPEAISRRDLLAEARPDNYESLHALDAARQTRGDPFGRLEKVVARFPGTFVASAAADDMATIAAGEIPGDAPDRHVQAMARATERCTDPVAIAQLKLESGHIYLKELKDPAMARGLYDQVARQDNLALAQRARESLTALDAVVR